jgi:hypothetical protein
MPTILVMVNLQNPFWGSNWIKSHTSGKKVEVACNDYTSTNQIVVGIGLNK